MKWKLELHDQARRDLKKLEKKRQNEWSALMQNLQMYLDSLDAAPHPQVIDHRFLHKEQKGVKAIDQSGYSSNLKQVRLYTYADWESATLHILCAGDKTNQSKDVKFAADCAEEIRSR